MKFKKISTKMLTVLLAVNLISMLSLSFISFLSGQDIVKNQIELNMNSELRGQESDILAKTQQISNLAENIGKIVENTYTTTSLEQYEKMLSELILKNDLAYGSGIWFEPFVYDKNEKYVGPYVYKEEAKTTVTYDYSNAEYDYFQYDWYKNAMKGSKNAVFSALYYDETLGVTMASCTVPLYNKDDNFFGTVTVDMEITKIQDMINNFKVGENGKAILLTSDGTFITNTNSEKVMNTTILEDDNKSLANLGNEILNNEKGTGNFRENSELSNAYYTTVDGLGWKIILTVPQSEIYKPLGILLIQLSGIGLITILISIIAIITQVRYVTKHIKKVNSFALSLSSGDFTVSELDITSQDELGQMGDSLNKMLVENKSIIKDISLDATEVNDVSEKLQTASKTLTDNFYKIETSIKEINESMMSSSAATEEVNASVEEMNASINYLAQETNKSYDMSKTIKERATEVEKKSVLSYEQAYKLAIRNQENLNKSLEDAKIVESISVMAEAISQIAEQVSLLSLNASIEAARAGDAGRGFAVVAKEIGNLASKTTISVKEIKETTTKIKTAFENLTNNSKQLLAFIQNTVTPDYKMFVDMATQYDKDAEAIQSMSTQIANMTTNIEKIINEVGAAIQNIAEASENTAENSGAIISNIDTVSTLVDDITEMSKNQKEISDNLDGMVKKFKL